MIVKGLVAVPSVHGRCDRSVSQRVDMALHRGPCPSGISIADCRENRLVLVMYLGGTGRVQSDALQADCVGEQRFDTREQSLALGGCGDIAVEESTQFVESTVVSGCQGLLACAKVPTRKRFEIGVRYPGGGAFARSRFKYATHHKDVSHVGQRDRSNHESDIRDHLDEAFLLKSQERLAYGHAGHIELGGEDGRLDQCSRREIAAQNAFVNRPSHAVREPACLAASRRATVRGRSNCGRRLTVRHARTISRSGTK